VPGLEEAISNQGVVVIKSHQTPRMYPKMDWVFRRPSLEVWSKRAFKPAFLHTLTVKTGKDKGRHVAVVQTPMLSLRHHKCMFPAYRAEERAILRPGRSWSLLKPGSETDREHLTLDNDTLEDTCAISQLQNKRQKV
jgi:hypothetical protein